MTKLNYTEEETNQILHSLFLEKKKVRELEFLLQELRKERHPPSKEFSDENAALQRQYSTLKDKLLEIERERDDLKRELDGCSHQFSSSKEVQSLQKQQIEKLVKNLSEQEKRIQELHQFEYSAKKTHEQRNELETSLESTLAKIKSLEAEKEALNKTLADSLQHGTQLERVIQHLRKRSEEAYLEADQLSVEFHNSRLSIETLTQDLKRTRGELDGSKRSLLEERNEKEELIAELKILQGQFEILKKKVIQSEELVRKRDDALENGKKIIFQLQQEKLLHEHQNKENKAVYQSILEEIALIKQALVRSLREAKELETHYFQAINEKASLVQKAKQMQKRTEGQSQQITELQNQLQDLSIEEKAAQAKIDELQNSFKTSLQNTVQELQNEISALRQELDSSVKKILSQEERLQKNEEQKQTECNELTLQLKKLTEEKQALETEITHIRAAQEERETRIKIAHQHLAKKVKEVSLLTEQIDGQKNQLDELQSNLNAAQTKIQEIQTTMDVKNSQERRLQEQLQETIKYAESQVSKWEEKYLRIYEKLQETENRNRELKLIEEKHSQMQALLSNLGNVIGAPIGFVQPQGNIAEELTVKPPISLICEKLNTEREEEVKGSGSPIISLFSESETKEIPQAVPNLFDTLPSPPVQRRKDNLFD